MNHATLDARDLARRYAAVPRTPAVAAQHAALRAEGYQCYRLDSVRDGWLTYWSKEDGASHLLMLEGVFPGHDPVFERTAVGEIWRNQYGDVSPGTAARLLS